MSEYIVDVPDEEAELFIARFGIEGTTMFGYRLADEIVRCRDCRNYHVVDEIFDGEDDTAVYGCGILGWKVASYGCEEPTDPDGFCAWGERKGDTE